MPTLKNPRLLFLLFVPVLAYCATLIPLRQLQAPAIGLVASNGSAFVVPSLSGATFDGTTLTITPPASSNPAPAIVPFAVTATSNNMNSFAFPVGKTCPVVHLNGLTYTRDLDYTVSGPNPGTSVSFFVAPSAGDNVLLECW